MQNYLVSYVPSMVWPPYLASTSSRQNKYTEDPVLEENYTTGTRKNIRDNLIQGPHFIDGVLKITQRYEVICPASKLISEFEGKK